MRSSSDSGCGQGESDRSQTEINQCHGGCGTNQLYIVGIGPGDQAHMSGRAVDVLKHVSAVAGYTTYMDLIKPLVEGKKLVSTTMKKEVDRVKAAIDIAMQGESCAIVSSGDPGIYAMAGLAFEICQKQGITVLRPGQSEVDGQKGNTLTIEVVPGIPALASGAALLGAPLTHDFAVVSLSDLLTPWERIEKRIEAAAGADFVIVIFNPRSKKRDWQLKKAQEIVLKHRHPDTPVGIVKSAMREGQAVTITRLGDLDKADVDMLSTVFIGSSASVAYLDFMITPRGYSEKYDI
ncbi:MAG: precorrin-3B C(17)-methyltransferase [Desulfobacteraceae bacterium]